MVQNFEKHEDQGVSLDVTVENSGWQKQEQLQCHLEGLTVPENDPLFMEQRDSETYLSIDSEGRKELKSDKVVRIMKQLERGDVNVIDLKKNIEYAASVLEAVYIDETRTKELFEDLHYSSSNGLILPGLPKCPTNLGTSTNTQTRNREIERETQATLTDYQEETSNSSNPDEAGVNIELSSGNRGNKQEVLNWRLAVPHSNKSWVPGRPDLSFGPWFGRLSQYTGAVKEMIGSSQVEKLAPTARKLLDTEDELSDIQTDSVPSEVRDWLASTFTRKMGMTKKKPEEKPKFRSIVHAVQAGIFVERNLMYRKTYHMVGLAYPAAVIVTLKQNHEDVDKWSFDVFALNEASGEHSLKFMIYELFTRYDLINRFKIPVSCLITFAEALEVGYSKYKNPYHNLIHAADVTQTVHYIMLHTGLLPEKDCNEAIVFLFVNVIKDALKSGNPLPPNRPSHWLTELEILAMVFAAAIHDYEHTGTTNNFHIQTRSDVAILYNDRSVLENHHVSAAYRLMQEEEMNILINLSKDDWSTSDFFNFSLQSKQGIVEHANICWGALFSTECEAVDLRNLVIEMVLSTDMSGHFQQIKNIRNSLQQPEGIDRAKTMSLILHAADISHPAKSWKLHYRWTMALMEEFFLQVPLLHTVWLISELNKTLKKLLWKKTKLKSQRLLKITIREILLASEKSIV
ncbi:Dual specificity calcium/calmodulin-dependent 3',5'-cyclic nucleotide phosphodiesterase 1A [Saguinus oedipus]|uniref:Phosphodiesterase n=1 Tax=Saguinus oedipus TaxID=9490 RepID=A0ABQ9VH86_SAGOE|nr:Dual specificity calcium/calmodulin-dependent 3',5'-cyclic nucleotide phosphodiesterase 1A [Saguinus oedipus]